jgi:hypothetical protein
MTVPCRLFAHFLSMSHVRVLREEEVALKTLAQLGHYEGVQPPAIATV